MQLAERLTEGLVNPAVEYRTYDEQGIKIMASEDYMVPKAFDIENLMEELYSFMVNPHYHPLIKASVSQAFILATRPFPSGNERLARMVSAIILYQSGYDFFKNVSLSRVIANEMPLYYNAMRETIREANDSDLTYFVEYYLNMLVKALQRMSPLITSPKPPTASLPPSPNVIQTASDKGLELPCDQVVDKEKASNEVVSSDGLEANLRPCSIANLMKILKSNKCVYYEIRDGKTGDALFVQRFRPGGKNRRAFCAIVLAVSEGVETFKVSDIAERLGMTQDDAKVIRDILRDKGFIISTDTIYTMNKLYRLSFDLDRVYLNESGIVIFYTNDCARAHIRQEETHDKKSTSMDSDKKHIGEIIKGLLGHGEFSMERKLGSILQGLVEKDTWYLTYEDLIEKKGCSQCNASELISTGRQLGIIYTDSSFPNGMYGIREYVTSGIHLEGMVINQYVKLVTLYEAFGTKKFNTEDAAKVLASNAATATRFSRIYYRRGLLDKWHTGAMVQYAIKKEAVDILSQRGYLEKTAV